MGWRAEYRAYVTTAKETVEWLLERTRPFDLDTPQLRALQTRFDALNRVLRPRARPMVYAQAFHDTVLVVAEEVRRTGVVEPVAAGWFPRLEELHERMVPYSAFRPGLMIPVAAVPSIGPLLLLWVFPESARDAMNDVDDIVFFGFLVGALSANFLIVRLVIERASTIAKELGPYMAVFVPPALLSFVSVFAMAYWIPATDAGGCMNRSLSKLDALYFSVTTFTTTGYGDIAPAASLCRSVATLEMMFTFFLVAISLAIYVSRASSR